MSDFTTLPDLACERVGGRVIAANDEFFAPRESLIKASSPIFIEGKYTEQGKWMDGWETRRRRSGQGQAGDWCIVKLSAAAVLRGVVVDTTHFKGNFPEAFSLDGCSASGDSDPSTPWLEILPRTPLKGDSCNSVAVACPGRFTHVRFSIYPDGGVARLRIHGEAIPDLGGSAIDLASVLNGGRILASSDAFFGKPQSLLWPDPPVDMGDGWETRRRRGPGHDWVVIRLATEGTVGRVEIDTTHFKGNYPESFSLETCSADGTTKDEILGRTILKANAVHRYGVEVRPHAPSSHVCLRIYPDGGVARIRLIGMPSREGRISVGMRRLNAWLPGEAETKLLSCCGSQAWASRMSASRPFAGLDALRETSKRILYELEPGDWSEAFSAHPRIGEVVASGWSADEQSSARGASADLLGALVELNRSYEARFGQQFIVCASGKNLEEMLTGLRFRLNNGPETELRISQEEQRKITDLRLEKLLLGT